MPPDPTVDLPPCPLCGSLAATAFTRTSGDYQVVRCRSCGLGRTHPQPSDDVLAALYTGEYTGPDARKFGGPVESIRRFFVRALAARIVRRYGTAGRALDVGCGDGKLLVALADRGLAGDGVELHSRVGERLPVGTDIKVFVGTLEEAAFPSSQYRVVVLRHVLEHLHDPIATLREVRRVIRPDGGVVIAVPNIASWQARLSRDAWFHLDLPRHLFHFTPETLTSALERTGFRVVRVSHFAYEQNPYGWLQSAFNRAGGRWRALYYQIRARGSAHAQPPNPFVIALGSALLPAGLALATVESLFGAGGAIEVWAEPT